MKALEESGRIPSLNNEQIWKLQNKFFKERQKELLAEKISTEIWNETSQIASRESLTGTPGTVFEGTTGYIFGKKKSC